MRGRGTTMKRYILQMLLILALVLGSTPLWGDVKFESFVALHSQKVQKPSRKAKKVPRKPQTRKPQKNVTQARQPMSQVASVVAKQPASQMQTCKDAVVGHFKQSLQHAWLVARNSTDKLKQATRSALTSTRKWIGQL